MQNYSGLSDPEITIFEYFDTLCMVCGGIVF